MKTKFKGMLLISLGVIIVASFMIASSVGLREENKIAPCVDGDGDINLEGIMCDKSYETFFGNPINPGISMLLFLTFPMGLGLIMIVIWEITKIEW